MKPASQLYTVVTNKEAKGRKGCLVAMIKGVSSDKVSNILKQLAVDKRKLVKEVTLDMVASMTNTVKQSFPKAVQVTDRFHVQQLASDAVQQMRIEYRWEAIDQENKEIELANEQGKTYIAQKLENGDTSRQLLARSRYLLFKSKEKWNPSQ